MRALVLAMLAGCSFFVPPKAWHPLPDAWSDDEWSCPPLAFPIIDGTLGAGLLTTSIYFDVRAQNIQGTGFGPALGRSLETTFAVDAMLVSLPWIISSAYGGFRLSSCREELARHNDVGASAISRRH